MHFDPNQSDRHSQGGASKALECANVLLSPVAAAFLNSIERAASVEQLDDLTRAFWRDVRAGAISHEEAAILDSAIARRRPPSRHANMPGEAATKPHRSRGGRIGSKFPPRQRQRAPDRAASRRRRRRNAASAVLPDEFRENYTVAQLAVLCVVWREVKLKGVCDLAVDKIGALAGVSGRMVQIALKKARKDGYIAVTERLVLGAKHKTNIINILAWGDRVKNRVKLISPHVSTEREERGNRGSEHASRPGPDSDAVPSGWPAPLELWPSGTPDGLDSPPLRLVQGDRA